MLQKLGTPRRSSRPWYKVGEDGGRRCSHEAEGNRDKERREEDRDTLWKRMCPNPVLVRRPVTCHPRPPGGRPSPRRPGAAPRGSLGQRWRHRDGKGLKRTHTPHITHIHNTHHTTHVIHTHHSHTNNTPSQHALYTSHTTFHTHNTYTQITYHTPNIKTLHNHTHHTTNTTHT